MRLNVTVMGDGPPLLLAHGLYGQGRNWGGVGKALARRFRVLMPDLRNHGDSPQAAGMTYADMAGDLAELLRAQGAAGATVLGHSMGGKAAMALALRHGALVGRLVVCDIAPRRYAPALRPFLAGMRALALPEGLTRREADAALADSVPDAGIRGFLLQSLDFEAQPPRWKLGLAAIAAGMPDIEGFDEDGRYEGETLVIAGARSDYIEPEDRALFLRLFPRAAFRVVEGAGHWVHADNPRGFLAVLEEWL
ncbi:alpha/beta fold hydrolase [Roseococcus sp. DSY-14]|uniref:alpha/beta fold hydrolase n=1 Tax=Roseococcus sp. DSY-14 TaxID=3369650 RepID=UPI00387B9025